MQHDAMVTTLRALKLFGMAQAVTELAAQGAPAYQGAQAILGSLLKAEMAEREVRSVAYQMKIARFPAYRDLAGFDFTQSVANEVLVRQLHRCEFMEQAHNVVLVGGPGTGKTHLATAFGAIPMHVANSSIGTRRHFFAFIVVFSASSEPSWREFGARVEYRRSRFHDWARRRRRRRPGSRRRVA